MESKLKKITYLAISLLMALLLNNTLIFNNGVQTELSVPKQSAVHEPIFIDGAATGVGAHNWTWAKDQSWCSGSGTWNDPYIIENLKIRIYLQDVNNARLINNTCSNLDLGIDIDTCNNNTISGNTANGNTNEGIYLYECYNNTISGNTVNDNNFGIYLSYCDYNNITGNTVNDNGESGILSLETPQMVIFIMESI
jgi:parallel beta-helix repeat protein